MMTLRLLRIGNMVDGALGGEVSWELLVDECGYGGDHRAGERHDKDAVLGTHLHGGDHLVDTDDADGA
jgi:hypothetical protein